MTVSGFNALNCPATVTYSDGTPTVSYVYDQGYQGALSSSSVTVGGAQAKNSYTYDALGRRQARS